MLSRMTTTLRHIMYLAPLGRAVDAGILLRSLYEHLVHFAWLAADPSGARVEEWRKDDLRQRLKADNDIRARGGQLFTDEAHAALKRQVDAMTGERLVLIELAEAADEVWAERLEDIGQEPSTGLKSFRGLYAIVYRNYSAGAHPSYRGLNAVVEDITATRKRVVLEPPYEGPAGPYGMATVLYSVALHVAHFSLGWPELDEIEAAFRDYPARR